MTAAATPAPHARTGPAQARRPHVAVWLVWAAACLAVLQAATTPPAALLLIGVAALTVEACGDRRRLAGAFPALVGAAAFFALLRVLLTALTTHAGEDVLARLPSFELPALLGGFTVGGTLHRAVLLRSLSEGLVVVAVIATLAAFNAVVSHHELLRLLPRAFHELALVVSVAVAFVPSALAAVGAVREADHARAGAPVGSRRGWARRLGAVLETSLERAILLSESMESRGFGHTGSGRAERRGSRLALLGLLSCSGAFGALLARQPAVALAAGALGAAALLAAVLLVSASRPRAGLPARRLERADLAMIAVLLGAPAGLLALPDTAAALRW
ncbi:MAG TPA: CbiQ family ECF transporter T component, partial [Egibacteraceae bacterium]|nr:CbiQ family ECF transporter T component [Egibacteraceae bacterium]